MKNILKINSYPNTRGATLFEALLYIALFSILSVGVVGMYTSVSRVVASLETTAKRDEIRLMFYEILRYNVDSGVDANGVTSGANIRDIFGRMLSKAYPQFTLANITIGQTINAYDEKNITLRYFLREIGTQRIYTETLSISLI